MSRKYIIVPAVVSEYIDHLNTCLFDGSDSALKFKVWFDGEDMWFKCWNMASKISYSSLMYILKLQREVNGN